MVLARPITCGLLRSPAKYLGRASAAHFAAKLVPLTHSDESATLSRIIED